MAVLFVAPGLAQQPPDNWGRFRFEGNRTFTAEQLRAALVAEPDFLLANHPHSDNADVVAVTVRLLKAGYERAGFHACNIGIVTAENGNTTITIDEGKRSLCGTVKVTGAKLVDGAALVDFLTAPQINPEAIPTFVESQSKVITKWVNAKGAIVLPDKPVWQRGKPSPRTVKKPLEEAVKAGMKSLGFPASIEQLSIKPSEDGDEDVLVIDILDEGERNRIDRFKIVGGNTNTAAQVVDFLELQTGMAYDKETRYRLSRKLHECGRFRKSILTFDRGVGGTGELRIELEDVPGVPPLSEPLSDDATIILRARKWLSDWDHRGEDIVFTLQSKHAVLKIVQSRQGTIVQIEPSVTTEPPSQTVILVDANHVGFKLGQADSVYIAEVSNFPGRIRLDTSLSAAAADDRFTNAMFNVNWNSTRVPEEPLLLQTLSLTPAGWCEFAYKPNVEIRRTDQTLVLAHENSTIEIEVETGRILRYDSIDSKTHLEPGVYTRLRDTFLNNSRQEANTYQSSRPFSSLVSYVAGCLASGDVVELREMFGDRPWSKDRPFHSAIGKMSSAGLFLPIDAFIVHGRQWNQAENFVIPDSSKPPTGYSHLAMTIVGKFGLKFLPDLFAEETWPMKVGREACLVVLDRGRHTEAVLDELLRSQEERPLRDASIAHLLSLIGQPAAKTFANRGLETLRPVAFDEDLKTLLSGRCGQWLTGIKNAITSLSDQELASVTETIKSDKLQSAIKILHQNAASTSDASSGPDGSIYRATEPILRTQLEAIISAR